MSENGFSVKFQRTSRRALDNQLNGEPIDFPLKKNTLQNNPYTPYPQALAIGSTSE